MLRRRRDLAAAEIALMEGKKNAKANVEKTRKALENPGDDYVSLRASLKHLEGPEETDASRRKPYPKTSTGRRTAKRL